MAEATTVARPYAEAVFKLARESGAFAHWSEVLALLEAVMQNEEVAQRASDPNLSAAQVEALLLGICGDRLGGDGRNFVQTLVHNNRLTLLPEIRVLYEQLRLAQEGVLEVQIQSAFALDDAQLAQIVAKLEAKHQTKIRAEVSVDPDLIGGVRIMVGDNVFDGTVRGRLDAMAAALIR
jgi:F-type H+-transporting ATPase subunit delta